MKSASVLVRGVLMLACGAAFLLTGGCAGLSPATAPLRAEARVPLEALPAAPGAQQRALPWSDRTLEARAGFKATAEVASKEGLSLGLLAARERLLARQRLEAELRRQLDALPASEPPPGERTELTFGQLAERRPALRASAEAAITAATPTASRADDGNTLLEARLALAPLATEVLNQGGGFAPTGERAAEVDPRQRAQREAEAQARSRLLQQLVERRPTPEMTYGEWLRRDAANREVVVQALRDARVVRSEAQKDADGREVWVMEFEFSDRRLRDFVRKQEAVNASATSK